MANFHMSIKVGSAAKGGASGHGDYIRRDEKVKVREDHPVDVITQNLPSWANSAQEFWLAADKFERKNGSSYREFECSLPVELSNSENIKLATEWSKKEFPNQFVEIALHWKAGNPHAHIQVCERVADAEKSSAEHYFKRPASNFRNRAGEMCSPSADKIAEGGCKKSERFTRNDLEQWEGESRKKYLKRVRVARKFAVREIRQSFADMTNHFLDKNGYAERVSSLSYKF